MIEDRLINISGEDINEVEIITEGSQIYLRYKGKDIPHIKRIIITPRNIEITQSILETTLLEQVQHSTDMIKHYFKKFSKLVGGNDER